jgi:hypothetical protein
MKTAPEPLAKLATLLLFGCATTQQVTVAQEPGFEPVPVGHAAAHPYDVEFFPGATYDASITTPAAALGYAVGARPAPHAEVVALWRTWAEQSPRATVETYARTFEDRECIVGVVTSPANHERLDEILAGIQKLADPRGVSDTELARIADTSPAVAWLGYSIHGDEMSGVDGGLALAHHLIAGTTDEVTGMLDELVVVFDPMLNPDGRERIRGMLVQSAGRVPNLDVASMHRGHWPWGRGNHYLFDMNRDWMPGIMPETRGRWRMALKFRPQLFVDAHEMGSLDTFLFYPQAEPFNPHLPATLHGWQKTFGDDQAAAFDQYGWSYYTREWADAWGPFYSDAWGSLNGAIGILYEQASFYGQPLRRASGEIVTYREAVHHQAVSSLANLRSLRGNRTAILKDYGAGKRANVEEHGERAFVLLPSNHPDRTRWFTNTLAGQGIEVFVHEGAFTAANVVDHLGRRSDQREIPAGALVVPAGQPQGALVRAYLEFDVRMDDDALLEERNELEREGNSKVYDVTSWNMARAAGLASLWCDADAAVDDASPLEPGAAPPGRVVTGSDAPIYGWLVDGADDAALRFAVRAMERGLAVHLSDESFEAAGRTFARGSLLVRRHENGDDAGERVAAAVKDAGIDARAVTTGRAPGEGADLGGGHFTLLARPRVALLSNSPVSADRFGHVWHYLDHELGVPTTLVDAQSFGRYDLRRYNVLVLPPAGGIGSLLEAHASSLRTWVRAGGTLIALAGSAGAIADEDLGLSSVRLLRDELDDLDEWLFAARREQAAFDVAVDAALVWDGASAEPDEAASEPGEAPNEADDGDDDDENAAPDAVREDRWKRRFAPRGASLLGHFDTHHWLTVGCERELPVDFAGSQVLLSRSPVRTAVRLAPKDELRLGGLLWPEAADRLAESAYLTVERAGNGQVILFASSAAFRGYARTSARLLGNAVVYGPGAGARQPLGW